MLGAHPPIAVLVRILTLALVATVLVLLAAADPAQAQRETPEELIEESEGGAVPGGALGGDSRSEIWRAIREGGQGTTSLVDPRAAQLIQSEGDNWRAVRNGPVSVYGVWAILGIVGLLALFFLLRGRVRIEHGRSERRITRFTTIERMGHWLLAVSFVVLALTGLNILYGRYVLPPVIGPEAFGLITYWGKLAHNYIAFPFMLGLATVLVMWLRNNLPSRTDVMWLLKGGGLVGRGHPPAHKFNAGQKIVFWLVILGGVSISLSGIALLFPFATSMFDKTFIFLNYFGLDLPTGLSPMQEMQLAQIWHTIMALFLTVVVLAHIYIGTVGMEGAFDAMSTGKVDYNWAREHHSLWVDELETAGRDTPDGAPAGKDRPAAEPAE